MILYVFLFLLILWWILASKVESVNKIEPFDQNQSVLNNENIIFNGLKGEIPNRVKINLEQELTNKWGFVPEDRRLTGNSQTKTYNDIYSYWDPNYNYTDYWNYSYPLTVYPRPGSVDYRSFGHSTYSNLFPLSKGNPIQLPYERLFMYLY